MTVTTVAEKAAVGPAVEEPVAVAAVAGAAVEPGQTPHAKAWV